VGDFSLAEGIVNDLPHEKHQYDLSNPKKKR